MPMKLISPSPNVKYEYCRKEGRKTIYAPGPGSQMSKKAVRITELGL